MSNSTPYANSVFEQPWWLDIVAPGKWREVIIKKDNEVIARLPYVVDGNKVRLPHYTQTLGIWMSDNLKEYQRGNDHYSQQKEIIAEIIKQIPYKNMDFVFDANQKYVLPFRWLGFTIDPTFSYRIMDLSSVEAIESGFSKSVKRDINRGKKLLTIDDSIDGIEDLINLQNLTFARQNRKNPNDNDFTRHIMRETISIGHGKLFVARDESGKAHAGSFMLFDEKVCYHLLSGQDTSFGNDCAMPLLIYNEILFASKVSKSFDFEGSMVEGIEQVYRRYGGVQLINWHVSKTSFIGDVLTILKPRVKRLMGYKI